LFVAHRLLCHSLQRSEPLLSDKNNNEDFKY
jgi:hypothetical protein